MFVHKLKFILATLNNYTCSRPPFATSLLFQSAFFQPGKFTTGEMVTMEGFILAVGT